MGGSASPLPALAGLLESPSAAEETKPPPALSRVLGGRAPKSPARWRGRKAGSRPLPRAWATCGCFRTEAIT